MPLNIIAQRMAAKGYLSEAIEEASLLVRALRGNSRAQEPLRGASRIPQILQPEGLTDRCHNHAQVLLSCKAASCLAMCRDVLRTAAHRRRTRYFLVRMQASGVTHFISSCLPVLWMSPLNSSSYKTCNKSTTLCETFTCAAWRSICSSGLCHIPPLLPAASHILCWHHYTETKSALASADCTY